MPLFSFRKQEIIYLKLLVFWMVRFLKRRAGWIGIWIMPFVEGISGTGMCLQLITLVQTSQVSICSVDGTVALAGSIPRALQGEVQGKPLAFIGDSSTLYR